MQKNLVMDAKELRIGNIINIDGTETSVLGLIQMSNGAPVFIQSNNIFTPCRHDIKYASPIPLTEEWLLKFGLQYSDEDEDYCIKWLSLESRATDNYSKNINKEDFGCWWIEQYIREIKYVHELQNIYFALTGEELTIKQ